MPDFRFERADVKCTCGVPFHEHKTGRCADAMLHQIAYGEIPTTHPEGTMYVNGIREKALFQEDLLVERDGELYAVPPYTADPASAFILFAKWYDIGGSARINMNRSGWSATFAHGVLRRYYGYGHMARSRIEWLTIRELSVRWIGFLRESRANDCDWIEGINPVIEDPVDGD